MANRGYEATESAARACRKQQSLGSAVFAEYLVVWSFPIPEKQAGDAVPEIIWLRQLPEHLGLDHRLILCYIHKYNALLPYR